MLNVGHLTRGCYTVYPCHVLSVIASSLGAAKFGQVATDFTQREGRISLSQRGRPSSYPTISNNVRSDPDALLLLAGRHRIASNFGKTIYRLKLPHQELCNQKGPQLQNHPSNHRNRSLQ